VAEPLTGMLITLHDRYLGLHGKPYADTRIAPHP
jgi:hypothetical protein